MFSTILKEVTSYFDRRALISAFFPSLVFWALTLILVLSQTLGWSTAFKGWEGLSVIVQGLLLIGLFVWVAFWSFLTINFRPALVRLYEGYWPEENFLIRPLKRSRRRYWQQRWDKLNQRDFELEEQENTLIAEREEYQNLLKNIIQDNQSNFSQVNFSAQQFGEELIRLKEEFQKLKITPVSNAQLAKLQDLGQQVRSWWPKLEQKLTVVTNDEQEVWNQYREQLQHLTNDLIDLVQRQFGEIEEQRLLLNQEFFLYYPPHRDDVMPTQLGNILKGAERSVQEHYQLDPVLIWSRLQPALPNEFTQLLQDAKMSLDLMVTLSGYILLFGLPLSIWLSLKSLSILPWWIALVQVILALFLRSNTLFIVALLTLCWTWVISSTDISLRTNLNQLQVLLILTIGVFLAAWVSYQNAVQAAVDYGEKIKAAFDLYRWKALEGLHLQLPPNHEEERKLWKEVCGLLYRSYSPDPRYYRYVKQTNTKELISPPATVRLPVPKKSLAADHLITADDITDIERLETQIPKDGVRDRSLLIGHYTLQSLPAHQPILMSALTDGKYLKDAIAVGIRATPAMTLGGQIKPGDIVNIIIMPASAETSTTIPTPSILENILVLDVRSVAAQESDKSLDYPFVVVIALPQDRQIEFATCTPGATLLISRKL